VRTAAPVRRRRSCVQPPPYRLVMSTREVDALTEVPAPADLAALSTDVLVRRLTALWPLSPAA